MKRFQSLFLALAMVASALTCVCQSLYAYDDVLPLPFNIDHTSVVNQGMPLTEDTQPELVLQNSEYVCGFSSITNANYNTVLYVSGQEVGGIKLGTSSIEGGAFTIHLTPDGQKYVESIKVLASLYDTNFPVELTISARSAVATTVAAQTINITSGSEEIQVNASNFSLSNKTTQITISSNKFCFVEEVDIYYNNNPSGKCGDNLTWEYNPSTGTLTITGSGAMYDYAGSYTPWNSYKSSITSIVLPVGLENIGDYAFYGCDNAALTSISIPSSVANIGDFAFSGCSGLTSISIPSSVTSIGGRAFYQCSGLTTLVIPSSVTSIEANTFAICSGLTSITVDPNNTVYDSREDCNAIIETSTNKLFRGCENTVIPSSVTSIGEYAFQGCAGLTSFTIPSSVTSIGKEAFEGCSALTSIAIPNSVTSIGNYAFFLCANLADVTVNWTDLTGVNVSSNAFYNLTLGNITLHVPYGTTTTYQTAPVWQDFNIVEMYPGGKCGDNLFWEYDLAGTLTITGTDAMYDYANTSSGKAPWDSYKADIESIILPDGLTRIGNHAFYGCDNAALTSITIPNSVTTIGEYAFSNFNSLTSIEIPASVTSLERNAFSFSENLNTVTFAAGSHLETIGEKAFGSCYALNSAEIPAGVTSIGEYAFQNCSTLVSVTIPETVTSIGTNAFAGCSGLTSITVDPNNTVYDSRDNCNAIIETSSNKLLRGCNNTVVIPSTVTAIGDYAFSGCSGLTSATIPAGVTIIGDRAFTGCTGLGSINFPDGVTSIGEYAFSGCSGLEGSITIPESVTSIGKRAFQNCSTLVSFTSLGSITEISEYTFYNCSGLSSATIPASVTSIGKYAFSGCSGLTSIAIPNSVTSIGTNAFGGCTGLTDIYVCWLSTPPTTPSLAFKDVDRDNTTLHVPSGYATTYGETSPWSSFTNIVADIPAGQCGDNLYWVYNPSTTTLTITGTGDMYDYAVANTSAWHSYKFDITSVILPDGMRHIGDYAFYYCDALPSITIPNSVMTIGKQAFQFCDALTSIIIPASVTGIGENAFYSCTNLATLTFAAGNAHVSIGKGAFRRCTKLTSISFSDGTTTIGEDAFYYCTSLTSINIPAGVTSIGDDAFWGCTDLTDVTVNWTNLSGITTHADAFYDLTLANVNLHVPAGTYATYAAVAPWSTFNILDPSCYGQCGDNLYWSYNPTSYTLTITGSGAMNDYLLGYKSAPWLKYHDAITIVSLPDGLTTIGDYAFYTCNNAELTSITISASVTSIGESAFEGCTSLASIEIKSSECKIGKRAFQSCLNLTSVTIRNSAATIGYKAFQQCENLTSVFIQNSVVAIEESAFANCYHLESFTLADGSTLTSIGKRAFYDCRGLTSFTIPSSVTSIGDDAFYNCKMMADIYVSWTDPETEVAAGSTIFYQVPNTTKLHLPFDAWGNYTASRWTKFKQVPMVTAKTDPENDGVFYNTFYHGSVAYALPAGVEAYTAKRSGENMILTKVAGEGQTLPAYTAVILKSTVQQYEMYPSDDTPVTVGENDLQGVDAAETAPANCYVLSGRSTDGNTTGVGFYLYTGTLAAHKAYLIYNGSSSGAPKRFRFVFDGEQTTTDIESPSLQGRSGEASKILRNGQLIIIRNGVEYNANGQMVR